MSSSSHAESEHCSLLELAQFSGPSTNTMKGKKRWGKAFAFIRCSRALDSQKINRRSLVQLVENESLDQLEEWGGLDAVAKALKTDLQNGISNVDAKDIAHRQSDYGSNTLKNPTPKSCFHFFWREVLKVKNFILLSIGAISVGLGGWYAGGCDLIAVLLSIAAATVVKFSLNRQLNELYKVGTNVQSNVVRKGQFQKISAFELVVGDVVCLKIGDLVPADGFLIEGHSVLVEKATEKGQGDRVEVNQSQNPFLFSGSKVIGGYGRMLVASVGMNTKWGQRRSQISPNWSEKTALEIRVQNQFSIYSQIKITVGIILSAVYLLYLDDSNDIWTLVMQTIVIFVETREIYHCSTLSIVRSMNRMMADKIALVRERSVCESMAMVTTICTHKTNIFTTNQVKKAVKDCQKAGVSIKMMTDDNIDTAKAIATECGILGENMSEESWEVIEAEKFRDCSPTERMDKIDQIYVMASASPSDKLLMVQCLKRKGHVVAATGDDINELPVLKEADIGLCMGIQGSEVAKQSSDIVILDDSFASVASVLSWGRCIYSNTQKLLQFEMTNNCLGVVYIVVYLFMVFYEGSVEALLEKNLILSVVQKLWLDLITKTLSIFVFGMGKPTKELMQKPPVKWSEPLITNIMLRNLVPQSSYQIAVLLSLCFISLWDEQITMIFNTWVLFHVFNLFNMRTLERKNVFEGVHRNKTFLGIISLIIVVQVMMVQFLNKFADTERLDLSQWGVITGAASLILPIGLVFKCIPVPEKPAVFKYLCVVEVKRYLERLILKKMRSLLISAYPMLLLMKFNQPSGAQNRRVTPSLIEEAGDGSHVINVELGDWS